MKGALAVAAFVLMALLAGQARAQIRYCHRPLTAPRRHRVSAAVPRCPRALISEVQLGGDVEPETSTVEAFVTAARCLPSIRPLAGELAVTVKGNDLAHDAGAGELDVAVSLGGGGFRFEYALVPQIQASRPDDRVVGGLDLGAKARAGHAELEAVAGPRVASSGVGWESQLFLRQAFPLGRSDLLALAARGEAKAPDPGDPAFAAGAQVLYGHADRVRLIADVSSAVEAWRLKLGLSMILTF